MVTASPTSIAIYQKRFFRSVKVVCRVVSFRHAVGKDRLPRYEFLILKGSCEMSNPNVPASDPNSNSNVQAVTCASGCQHKRSGMLRAVLYTPVVLILGGLATLAAFPDLAEYASPLIGHSSSNSQCPLQALMSGSGGCCARKAMATGSCSSSQAGSCSASSMPCCTFEESSTSAEPANDNLTMNESADESPVDALAVVNAVDLETPSN